MDQPGETPSQRALRLAVIDQAGDLAKSILEDGGDALHHVLTAGKDVGELRPRESTTLLDEDGDPGRIPSDVVDHRIHAGVDLLDGVPLVIQHAI